MGIQRDEMMPLSNVVAVTTELYPPWLFNEVSRLLDWALGHDWNETVPPQQPDIPPWVNDRTIRGQPVSLCVLEC